MIGAIIGDVVGSTLEFKNNKTKDFSLFEYNKEITDDSILTMAVFSALEKCNNDYQNIGNFVANEFISFYKKYPNPMGAYGASFENWCINSIKSNGIQPPYNSYGNGAAMRISPVAYFSSSMEECIKLSRIITGITHNHLEGIKGAEAISSVIYMALNCKNKQEIKEYINDNYYVLDKTCNEIRKSYTFNETCMGTVPEAIESFLESTCYEDAIRIAISLGGDADTIGAITGSMAEAYYGIPESIEEKCFEFLDKESKDISRRMIYKRESVANRYLETKGQLFKEGFFFARYSVSDMDGRPNSRQKNFMFTYNNKRYECRNGLDFIVVNEDSSTNRMNENEFMFFIDEIRLFLYRRFSMFIGSVEDAYANTLLELSNNFWKGKKE